MGGVGALEGLEEVRRDAVASGGELLELLAWARLEEHLVQRVVLRELIVGNGRAVDVERALVSRREVDAHLRLTEHELAGLRHEHLDAGIDEGGIVVARLGLHESGNDRDECDRDQRRDADPVPLHGSDLA